MVMLLGHPTYNPYFKFLQQDHKLPPDPRALRRAGMKGGIVGFLFFVIATICLQLWFLNRLGPLAATNPALLPDLWGSPLVPLALTAWSAQLLFHTYPSPQVSGFIGHSVQLTWTIEIAFVLPSAFAFGFYVMTANAKDRVGLSMEHGSSRYTLPEEIIEIMPRNYDIWEGFTGVEEARRKMDQTLFEDRITRVEEYSRAYLQWESELNRRNDLGLPSLPEDFSPMQHPEIVAAVEHFIGVDPALLDPADMKDVTPEAQPQITPGVTKYEIDPALKDEPPPALSA